MWLRAPGSSGLAGTNPAGQPREEAVAERARVGLHDRRRRLEQEPERLGERVEVEERGRLVRVVALRAGL